MRIGPSRFILAVLLLGLGPAAWPADNAPFDLAGPQLRVMITRGTRTLPVADVRNWAVGDRVATKPEWPDTQAARYVRSLPFWRAPPIHRRRSGSSAVRP